MAAIKSFPTFLLIVIFLFISLPTINASTIYPMPPHPDFINKINAKAVEAPFWYYSPELLEKKGINIPTQKLDLKKLPVKTSPVSEAQKSSSDVRIFKKLVILVDFPDQLGVTPSSFFDSLVFENNGTSSVWKFYWENSYAQFDIISVDLPSDLGWQTTPQLKSYYVNDYYGFGSYPNNTQKMVEDIVDIIDPLVNFSEYDNDDNGYVDGITVIHAGSGAELSRRTTDIWSHKWGIIPRLKDGVYISSYDTEPEYWYNSGDMTIGVYAHEFGHTFGLPDLYDTDGSSRGIGRWSLMAGGSWNGNLGNSPAHLDAWSKAKLKFINPTNITNVSLIVQLPQIETSPEGVYRLLGSNATNDEYYLIENRQKVLYDSSLPSAGLLIWHIDEKGSNNKEWYPTYNSSGNYLVALEQADGLYELERNIDQGDSGDPFPGITINRNFNAFSTPSSDYYDFSHSGVSVENISSSGIQMSANVTIGSPPEVGNQNGSLYINSSPQGAQIYLEGVYKGLTPLTINNLPSGSYQLTLTKSGYIPYEQFVTILPLQTTTVNAILALPNGNLTITSVPPFANVYFEGAYVGLTPITLVNLPPGDYELLVTKTNYANYSANVAVISNSTTFINALLVELTASISIASTPPTALVLLDEVFQGFTPFLIRNIPLGMHLIELTKIGYLPYSENINFISNSTLIRNITLSPEPSPSPSPSPTPTPQPDSCTDSDNGIIPDMKGFVYGFNNGNYYNESDYCLSEQLMEYYCTGNQPNITALICNFGCNNGACMPQPSASPTPSPSPTPQTGAIYGVTNPSGANMSVDFIFRGLTPLLVEDLLAGIHAVEFNKAGYEDYNVFVGVAVGNTINVTANLTPITPSPSPTATPTPTPSSSPTPTPTATPTPSPSPSPSPTSTATPTPSPTPTPTPSPSPTPTATPTPSPSPTPTVNPTPSPTATPTPSPSPTTTSTPSPSITPSPSPTATPTPTPSPSATPTPSISPSPSGSPSPSITPSPNATISPSPSISPSPNATVFPSPSISPSPSASPSPSPTAPPGVTPQFVNGSITVAPFHDYGIIKWITDIISNSAVFYGEHSEEEIINQTFDENGTPINETLAILNTSFNFTNSTLMNVTNHSIYLYSLIPVRHYDYFVVSCNGDACVDSDILNFTTQPVPTPQPTPTPPPNTGTPGTYVPPSTYFPSQTSPSPTSSPTPSPSPSPQLEIEFIRITEEVDELIEELPDDSEEIVQANQFVVEAEKLLQRGERTEAYKLLTNVRERLIVAVATSKEREVSDAWNFALILIVLVSSAAIYYAQKWKKIAEEEKN